jgi:hypothetical protein
LQQPARRRVFRRRRRDETLFETREADRRGDANVRQQSFVSLRASDLAFSGE